MTKPKLTTISEDPEMIRKVNEIIKVLCETADQHRFAPQVLGSSLLCWFAYLCREAGVTFAMYKLGMEESVKAYKTLWKEEQDDAKKPNSRNERKPDKRAKRKKR